MQSKHPTGSKKFYNALRARFPDRKSDIDSEEKKVRGINKRIYGSMSSALKKYLKEK